MSSLFSELNFVYNMLFNLYSYICIVEIVKW